jgi:hypothetical protein
MRRPVLLLILLTGCVTSSGLTNRLEAWQGYNADELVRAWGPPTGQYTAKDGSQVFSYGSAHIASGNDWMVGSKTLVNESDCVVTFQIGVDKRVQSSRWEGNKRKCNKVIREARAH